MKAGIINCPNAITPEQFAGIVAYIRQQSAHLRNPKAEVPADIALLKVLPAGSQIKSLAIGLAPWGGQSLAAIRFHHAVAARPRFVSLGLWAVCLLAIAVGTPLSLKGNEPAGGFLYPNLKPYKRQFYLPRLLKIPGPGKRVKPITNCGIPTNHHYIANRTMSVVGRDNPSMAGPSDKSPSLGRPEFCTEIERRYTERWQQLDLVLTPAEFATVLKAAFEVVDAE